MTRKFVPPSIAIRALIFTVVFVISAAGLGAQTAAQKAKNIDEVMTLELDRMAAALGRVVVGVVIQDTGQRGARTKTFAAIGGTGVRIREGHTDLAVSDFADVPAATAAVVAEFTRDAAGVWSLDASVRGFDADPDEFTRAMGAPRG